MARAERYIDAPPEEVFGVLADARTYSEWVVGSREIRAADEHWPAVESAFDHRVGIGPLTISDHTAVRAALPPVMVELRAHARPLGVARVVFQLVPEGPGTRVIVIEDPDRTLVSVLIGPLGHALLKLRNAEMLRRLGDLAEGRVPRPGGALPGRETTASRS